MRFPGYLGEWKKSKIQNFIDSGDLVSHLDGNHGELYPRASEFAPTGVPYISATDLNDGRVDFSRSKRLPIERAEKFTKGVAKPGDILFAHNATVGPTAILNTDFDYVILSTTVTYFRFSEKNISSVFFYHAINTEEFVRQYSRVMAQSTRNQVPITTQRKFFVMYPTLGEQKKIAAFLSEADQMIVQLGQKKSLLEDYKKGCMQKLFTRELRFKDAHGHNFPDWEEKRLGEALFEHKKKSDGVENVFSVSVHKGLVDQIEHLGRSFSAADTGHYNLVEPGDVVYTKSPTGDFPFGIIKQSRLEKNVIVSPLYGVFRPETTWLGYWLHVYFESSVNTGNYLKPIIQKGAKNTINITNSTFLSNKLFLPVDHEEQRKIADFLSAIDAKIDLIAQELGHAKTFKKGLLQQMFL